MLFWIHGGGNIDGASDGYDGTKLASQGHVVVVTINYRLGLLGFLAHPAIDSEGHLFGNYGILDQQFAMKWVKRNIAKFGGDGNNITIGGQSAGSLDSQANMVSPLAAGLFQRAIFESGVQEPAPLSFAESKRHGVFGCGRMRLGNDTRGRQMFAQFDGHADHGAASTASSSGPYVSSNGVIADGQILPANFAAAYRTGDFNHVPVISGMTHDEGNFGLAVTEYYENPRVAFSATDYTNIVTSIYTGNSGPAGTPPPYPAGTVQQVMSLYPLSAYTTPQLALSAIETDGSVFFPCTQRQINRLIAANVSALRL